MKSIILAGLLFGAAHGLTAPVEAHTKEKAKLICDGDGCTVKVVTHTHAGHHHHPRRRTKIKFTGDVCRYKPWKNITVCRY